MQHPTKSLPGVQLPFAYNPDGALIHAADAPRRTAYKCTCPGCGGVVYPKGPAVPGSPVPFHFAHDKHANCSAGSETAIHLAAKQILMTECRAWVPGIFNYSQLTPGCYQFSNVRAELPVANFKPDILVKWCGVDVALEMAFTHFVDDEKRAKVRAARCYMIEYNLSDLRDVDWDTLRDALTNRGRARWISHPDAERQADISRAKASAEKAARAAASLDAQT